jgi:tRNA(Ile)-lysidine synthase
MEKKVIRFIKQEELIKAHSKVLVGVSGGPDSMALLHLLHRLQAYLQIEVMALALDHQLRGDVSRADVTYVKNVCERLNIPFISRSLPVATYQKENQLGTQVAARMLRYEAYAREMKTHNMDYIALGHHADDQMETVVMSLIRTTTTHSLTGMPIHRPFASGQIIRPLLCVTKEEIEHYCDQHQIHPRLDASNLEDHYTRNRIRHHVIPLLKKENPNVTNTIQHLTATLREEDVFLNQLAKRSFTNIAKLDPKSKTVLLSIHMLNDCPVPLQRRIFRLTLNYLYQPVPDVTYKHEMAFLSLFKKKGNKRLHFPENLIVEKSYGMVRCSFQVEKWEGSTFKQIVCDIPAAVSLPNGATLTIRTVKQITEGLISSRHTYVCPKIAVEFPLTIRTREPGDRMQYKGLHGSKKIKAIFIDEKIPIHERNTWCMVVDKNEQILWLIGLKKHEQKRLDETDEYLLFEYKKK